jgi:hypothetical protein
MLLISAVALTKCTGSTNLVLVFKKKESRYTTETLLVFNNAPSLELRRRCPTNNKWPFLL